MKKLFLTVAVTLGVFSAASAQGNMWVGGTAGVWSSKVKGGDSQLSFKVMPEFGYIISENIGVGIALGGAHTHGGLDANGDPVFSTSFDGSILSGKASANQYTVSPFLRYTFLKSDLGALFFDGGVSYSWLKVNNTEIEGSEIEVGLRPGVAINVSNKVALIGKFGFLGYQTEKLEIGDTESKSDSFGFDFDMSNVQLGVSFKF